MKIDKIKVGTKFKVTCTARSADQIGNGIGTVVDKESDTKIWAKMNGSTYEQTFFTLTSDTYTFKILKY